MNIAFIGFGGVGQALAEILHERQEKLEQEYGLKAKVVAVADKMKGSVYHPDGLDVPQLIQSVREDGNIEAYSNAETYGLDSIQTIKDTNADMIVEVTFTDVQTGQPAIEHCETAFKHGKSVVTTNKGPVALKLEELQALADENDCFFGFEGTVMSGTPALRLPKTTLMGNDIKEVVGILNGTTNYILTEMEKGFSFNQALKQAQEYGYAEADPTSDIEGYDVRYKTAILSHYVMGEAISALEIPCEGIREMTQDMIQEALGENKHWKLLARIKKTPHGIEAAVGPEKISNDHPLASIQGATNAIMYDCDLAGPIMLTGAGAGLKETGFSLLIEMIHVQQSRTNNSFIVR
ncbi:homoserine dehydrogenase [Tenuibacillus multivorans]|uniref:Homoserine dehydrogenase n=1 Tax=Tenuibacillus multivorans TaxID=237069 RepID=A0A1G9YFI3_9BACI|nr:homoserine dehydrogenase [Tenuibacillus multivorans]GEL78536.1 homoserine dehydrogenase [Tenuibacillus multivorans]SDN07812.1 homoserine dehydrogenase [Tenuibacillus multivorans]